ncbi:hypothetical protein ABPG75_007539 [Micractinium tetrahymenae]
MGSSPNGPCGLFRYDTLAPLQTSRWPRSPPPLPPSPPPPPSPPLDSDPPEGDLCWFYSRADAPPYRLLVNVSSCECYSACASHQERNCVYRKYCSSTLKLPECADQPLVQYSLGNPCPSPPPPPKPPLPASTPVPPAPPLGDSIPPGDSCLLYDSSLVPYQLLVGLSACQCYLECVAQELCARRRFCGAEPGSAACKALAPIAYNQANPCASPRLPPTATPTAVPKPASNAARSFTPASATASAPQALSPTAAAQPFTPAATPAIASAHSSTPPTSSAATQSFAPPPPRPPPPKPSPPPPPPPLVPLQPLKRDWAALTSSSDGSRLSAVASGSYWFSSGDGSRTWTAYNSVRAWTAAASTADGSVQYAAEGPTGYVYLTVNYWANTFRVPQLGQRAWASLAATSAGATLVAAAPGSNIWKGVFTVANASAISVATTECTGSGARNWVSVASSADGSYLLAAEQGGYLYRSTDSCSTWAQITDAGQRNWWTSLAASRLNANETRLVAAVGGGSVWTAVVLEDDTSYWTASVQERTAAGSRAWAAVALSADASKLAAAAGGGFVHRSSDGGPSGLRLRAYTGLPSPAFPADYSALTLAADKVLGVALNCDVPALGTCANEVSSGDNFALQLTGSRIVPATDTWTLRLCSDDGSQLWLDGSVVLDHGGLHSMIDTSVSLTLTAGWHTLRIDYFDYMGDAGLRLEWFRPGWYEFVVVPLDNLSPLEYKP